jgi:hypothetical protein
LRKHNAGYNFDMNRFFRILPGLLLAVCLLLVAGEPARGQSAIFRSSVTVEYAQTVTFRLVGEGVAAVERIDLFLQAASAERPFSVQVTRVNQTADQLTAAVDVDPATAALPPFAEVRFWWVLQTAVDSNIVVPDETFFYEDNRLAWRTLAIGDVTIHWTGNDEKLGSVAADIVAHSSQTLDAILPQTAIFPLNLYIYPSTADLRTGLRLAGRDWQEGHTDPDLGVLLVTAVNSLTAAADLGQSIPHELTHLRLHHLAPDVAWPRWYEEGIALLAEGSTVGTDLLATAVANDTTLPILNLCLAFPESEADTELALAQSVSLLRHIQAQLGSQALRQLGTAYLSGAGCEVGLTETLDMSLVDLNVEWLAAEAPQAGWVTFLNANGLWLLLLLASFGFLALLLRR